MGQEQSTNNVIRYSDVIQSDNDFDGQKFREVLESHGISVINNENGLRTLKYHGNEDRPDIYIPVCAAPHNFDRMMFSELDPERAAFYKQVPQYPIERRLALLNSELAGSGYFFERVSLDMLNSDQKLDLKLSPKAEGQLQRYYYEVLEGIHSHYYYFNNPEGEEEREAERQGRTFDFMMMAEKALIENGRPIPGIRIPQPEKPAPAETQQSQQVDVSNEVKNKMKMTIVIGGNAVNFEMNAQQHDKLMAVDNSHRLAVLQQINPALQVQSMTREQKNDILQQVNAKLFDCPRPEIYLSESVQETQHVQPTKNQQQSMPNPKALAQANYAAYEAGQQGRSQEQSQSQGIVM